MAIPDYQRIMLPLLKLASGGSTHAMSDAIEQLAAQFSLSEGERKTKLPSGRQYTFNNRVGWARTYMQKALLLESPERGYLRITDRGEQYLKGSPKEIGNKTLEQFAEFREFRSRKANTGGSSQTKSPKAISTPEELLEEAHTELQDELILEILRTVKSATPRFFEILVVDLLVKMGYGGSRKDAGEAIGKSGDEGIDGIIKQDKLGLDVIYIQAKRWEGTVGRPILQQFAGSLDGRRARRGVFITTSTFSPDARQYVNNIDKNIVLIDGVALSRLMIEHDLGVSSVAKYEVKRIDSDYFIED